MAFNTSDSASKTKFFSLSAGEEKVIGFKIINNDDIEITGFNINFTSNAQESCSNQLSIDIGEDDIVDWVNNRQSNSFCSSENYGCYSSSSTLTPMTLSQEYCEKITIDSAAALLVGAELNGTGNAEFKFRIDESECSANLSGSGKASCIIDMGLENSTQLEVCVSQVSGNAYSIFYETSSPCGFTENHIYDFSVFARPIQYGVVGNVVLNETYGLSYYDGDCSKGCIIPIKFKSQVDQQISINSARIEYTSGIVLYEDNIYQLEEIPSLISMPYSQIFLNEAELKVPSLAGRYNISLMLGDKQLLKKSINVLSLPVVDILYPSEIPAGIETRLYVFVSKNSGNITKYEWNFGDNTTATTTTNNVVHKFSSLGNYEVSVKAYNANGGASKTFSVIAISPANYIVSSINSSRSRLESINSYLASLPSLLSNSIKDYYNITSIDAALTSLENDYTNAAGDSEKYILIANQLSSLNMPGLINLTASSSGKFILDRTLINIEKINSLGSETIANNVQAKDSIFRWLVDNLIIDYNLQTYKASSNVGEQDFSYIKFTLNPKEAIEKLYFIFEGNIFSQESFTDVSGSKGLIIENMNEGFAKNIELVSYSSIDPANIPVYLSPMKSSLEGGYIISECNNNKLCDKDSGETWMNCRSDCKPISRALLFVLLALFIVFCMYIAAQEWYKRKYENYLFKDKNDLYNLINFISNAEKQSLNKEEMFVKLRDKDWASEQTNYAYRKFKGLRTGMWEIPIFKFLENNRVKKELDIRKNENANNIPQPANVFLRKNNNFNQSRPSVKELQKSIFANPSRIGPKENNSPVQKFPFFSNPRQSGENKNIFTQKPIGESKKDDASTDKK